MITMVAAYSDTTTDFGSVKNKFVWEMTLFSDGHVKSARSLGLSGAPQMGMSDSTPWLNVHGIFMWVAWSVLGCF